MKLEPGETKCDKCDGIGNFGSTTEIQEYECRGVIHRVPGHTEYKLCPKCKGTGKLDWIEQVVGKKCIMVKPGVYTREVDLTYVVTEDTKWKII